MIKAILIFINVLLFVISMNAQQPSALKLLKDRLSKMQSVDCQRFDYMCSVFHLKNPDKILEKMEGEVVIKNDFQIFDFGYLQVYQNSSNHLYVDRSSKKARRSRIENGNPIQQAFGSIEQLDSIIKFWSLTCEMKTSESNEDVFTLISEKNEKIRIKYVFDQITGKLKVSESIQYNSGEVTIKSEPLEDYICLRSFFSNYSNSCRISGKALELYNTNFECCNDKKTWNGFEMINLN